MKRVVQNCDVSLIREGITIDDLNTFDYEWFYNLPIEEHGDGETRAQRRKDYIKAVSTLDIETTNIDDIEQSITYIWQFCINGHCVIGRYLKDLKIFFDRLTKYMDKDTYLMCYIHNESFEFHNLREVLDFENVFSVDKRKPIKCTYSQIEFRCSYILSNRNLDSYLDVMGVSDKKTKMDYRRHRYPWSKLNAKDTQYCLHDVIGLWEALEKQLDIEDDTLYTIPLTSTGYTRRDVRAAMYKRSRCKDFQEAIPTFDVFLELMEAFRGGNTHANRWIVGKVLYSSEVGEMHGADKSSSYPDSLLNNPFPWKFEKTVVHPDLLIKTGKAVLTRAIYFNLRMRDRLDGAPYIPKSKCRAVKGAVEDNGRLLNAKRCGITLTDLDIKIIDEQYVYDDVLYYDTYKSDYKHLPVELKRVIANYYRKKTSMKGVEGLEQMYEKFKNRFNAIYGLMVQNPARLLIEYDQEFKDLFRYERKRTLREVYEKNKHKLFLLYQWGVWCTARSRSELQKLIKIVQTTPNAIFLYSDTDSVKYIGDVDFSEYNKIKIEQSKRSGAVATDAAGQVHYIGIAEKEQDMIAFCTRGAKKYAYVTPDNKLHLTLAGVNKKLGAEELGTIENFKTGFKFKKAGGLEAKYNDRPPIRKYIVNGKRLDIYSNIYLTDSTYTVGYSKHYKSLLDNLERLKIKLS